MIEFKSFKTPEKILHLGNLKDRVPIHAKVNNTDLVVIRYDDQVSVLYGRCHHRGALLSDGYIDGNNLICGLHYWDYRYDTGVSEYNNAEVLKKFNTVIHDGTIFIDKEEIMVFEKDHPPSFKSEEYLGDYQDTHPEDTEPYNRQIRDLAVNGLKNTGRHGSTSAMGVERSILPLWEDIQILPAQLDRKPLADETDVNTQVIIGPAAKKPLELSMPVFVSDMSFGALSKEAKVALSKGAEMADTGICSGEGGMLSEEQENNTRYFYELASGKFGFEWEKLQKVQAFHFKAGQGAKTGVGGHLPGHKVTREIAEVRGLNPGEAAISPLHLKI